MTEARTRPEVLYKYLPPQNWVRGLITGKSLKFTCPLEFNDPFELACTIRYIGTPEELRAHWMRVAKTVGGIGSVSERRKVAQKSAIGSAEGFRFQDLSSYREGMRSWGVLSLSARPDSLLMWAHYADMHKGICVGFSADADVFAMAVPVEYALALPIIERIPGPWDSAQSDELLRIMTTKSADWSYEHEWRAVKRTNSGEDMARLLSIPDEDLRRVFSAQQGPGLYEFNAACIREIVFGVRAAPEWKRQVREWADEAGVRAKFLQARSDVDRYAVSMDAC